MKFRKLRADEIDCRVATVTASGCSLLLYKDARCDMNILDEEIGAMNWKREHSRDNANCTVSLWDAEKKQWVSKEDTGTESSAEKEKGLASDSFKRACFNWGIGRELYTAPFIWIPSDKCKVEKKQKGEGYTCRDKFSVSTIGYDKNGCISSLSISKGGSVVYSMGQGGGHTVKTQEDNARPEPEREQDGKATAPQIRTIRGLCRKHGVSYDALLMSNMIAEGSMTGVQAANIINSFKKKFGES